jgi:hypothetical protein
VDTLHTQVEAADRLAALAETHIAPAEAAHTLAALAEACTVPALALAAGRLAGLGPPRPPERFARHPRLAR